MDIQLISKLQEKFGTGVLDSWRIYRNQVYDYVAYPAAGTTQLRFMAVPLGGTDPNSSLSKTLEDTNLKQSGQIDGQTFFALKQIRMHANIQPMSRQPSGISSDADSLYTTFPGMMSKWAELGRRGVLNVSFGQTLWYQIERPIVEAPAGFGLVFDQYAGNDTAGAAQRFWTNYPGRAQDVWNTSDPVIIEPSQTITTTLDYPDGTSPVFTNLVSSASPVINIGLIFDGYIIRTAQ